MSLWSVSSCGQSVESVAATLGLNNIPAAARFGAAGARPHSSSPAPPLMSCKNFMSFHRSGVSHGVLLHTRRCKMNAITTELIFSLQKT